MSFDLKQAYTFMSEDSNGWRKILIGGGVTLIPILGPIAALGYLTVLYRGVISDLPDDKVLPEWEDLGDYFFKGLSLFAVLLCYAGVFGLLFAILAILTSISFFASALAGENPHGFFLLPILGFIVLFLFGCLFWTAAGLFAETLEVGSAFRLGDIIARAVTMGKEYAIVIAVWAFLSILGSQFAAYIPYLGYILTCIVSFWLAVGNFYLVAQIMDSNFSPELTDPIAPKIESSISVGFDGKNFTDDEDEYGYAKQGRRKASSLAYKKPDTSLTWSTDSDEAE